MSKDYMVCIGEPRSLAGNLPNISVVGKINYKENFSNLQGVKATESIFFCGWYSYTLSFLVYNMSESQTKLAKLLSHYIDFNNNINKRNYAGSREKMKRILGNKR